MTSTDSTPSYLPQRLIHSVEGRTESNQANAYGDEDSKLPKVTLPNVIANSAAQKQTPTYNGVLAKQSQDAMQMSKDFITTPGTAVSYLNTAGGTTTAQETMNTTQMNRTMKTNSDDNNSV